LIGFLEKNNLGWTGNNSSTVEKRSFVEGVPKALFQCGPCFRVKGVTR
jgi:hypothetical protein